MNEQLEILVEEFIGAIHELAVGPVNENIVLRHLRQYRLFSELTNLRELTVESLVKLITQIEESAAAAHSTRLDEIIGPVLRGTKWLAKQGAALGLWTAATAASKKIDQDVEIVGVNTTDTLGVSSPNLEKLLLSTQEMIQNLTDTLAKSMKELDDSVDYNTAAASNLDINDVQAAQAMHMGPEHGPRSAPVSKKAKVSKAVDKREKTK